MLGNREEYIIMSECERELWWYDTLHEKTLTVIRNAQKSLDASILDLGCGTGGLLSRLQNAGYSNIQGFDLSTDAVEIATSLNLPVEQGDVREIVTRFPSETFDIVVMHDVFYFFDLTERQQLFNSICRLLRPGGILMMNLPAFDIFAGTHDDAVGIKKRFTPALIEHFIDNKGGIRYELRYWPFFLSPVIAMVRTLQRLGKRLSTTNDEDPKSSDLALPHPVINKLLRMTTRLENLLGLDRIWGSSIFLKIQKD